LARIYKTPAVRFEGAEDGEEPQGESEVAHGVLLQAARAERENKEFQAAV